MIRPAIRAAEVGASGTATQSVGYPMVTISDETAPFTFDAVAVQQGAIDDFDQPSSSRMCVWMGA